MTYRFTARAAAGDEEFDEDYRQAGVAEFKDGSGFILLFMRGIEEAEGQDVDLAMDTHCVVTADQGTAYGCVREVAVRDGTLRVVLDPAALEDLGLDDPVIEAVLDVPEADMNRMRDVLRRIFTHRRADARPVLVDL
ncbi:Imm10 family immunity protein [Sphaerimonospora sp. CA-214678]|uniref:Imm10 family immunity protein n=1 Tax=Sphaerimonospora sp. CA-214678 TaxID=3240029 RepID=UPI003D90B047